MTTLNKIKPSVSGEFVRCLCIFKPESIDDEAWVAMSVEERDQQAEWTSYRFKIKEVQSYNRAHYPSSVTIVFENGHAMCCNIEVEWLDAVMDKYYGKDPA